MTTGQGGDINERAARGFEALVQSEQGKAAGPPPPRDQRARPERDDLSERVRRELEAMRLELQQATDDLATEREELRNQIAKTVGAANKWFVKARDQLVERLDEIAELATKAERAASAAAAGRTVAGAVAAAVAADAPPQVVQLAKPATTPDGDEVFEWDVENGEAAGGADAAARLAGATVDLDIESSELDALMEPVRDDVRELMGEISAVGQAVADLRDDVAALAKRVPTRPKPVRLDERDIDVIVEAVIVAMTPPPPAKKAVRKAPKTTAR